jgi:hypothetical protein
MLRVQSEPAIFSYSEKRRERPGEDKEISFSKTGDTIA